MLLSVEGLCKRYKSGVFGTRIVDAVNNVSFGINKGEIFGLIGESGCGKTSVTKMILGLLKPTGGRILFEGRDITNLNQKQWHTLRKDIQVVFQHPQMTFNPRKDIYFACAEPVRLYELNKNMTEEDLVKHMLKRVGIPFDQMKKFPHEISGGQAQRISIARALSLNPKLLICDEPTSMLDVSVQAQILRLIKDANEKYGVSMLFISHDLEVIQSMCSRVAVMEKGRIVEMGTVDEIFNSPKHEYTKKLMDSYIYI